MSALKKSSDEDSYEERGQPLKKRLEWSSEGSTNLIHWSQDVIVEAQDIIDVIAECLSDDNAPRSWVQLFVEPEGYATMSTYQQEKVDSLLHGFITMQ